MSVGQLLELLVWLCVVPAVFYIFALILKVGKNIYWICCAAIISVLGWALAPDCMCTDVADRLTSSLVVAVVVSVAAVMLSAFMLKLKGNIPSRKV